VDISILRDADQEVDQSFSVELTLQYVFDIALDTYTVTIVDSGELRSCVCGRVTFMNTPFPTV